MAHTTVIQSSREGAGTSTLVANIATLMASEGLRVGVIDADLQSESLHIHFNLPEKEITYTFNDYLFDRCDGRQVVYDVTPRHAISTPGCVLLIPASSDFSKTFQVLRQGYNIELITDGLWQLADQLELDELIIDTSALLNDETLLSILGMAICDTLAIVLCLDQKDYQHVSVALEVSKRLEVPEVMLIINQVSAVFQADDVKEQLEKTYECHVAGVVPYASDMMSMSAAALFVLRHPWHPVTDMLRHITQQLLMHRIDSALLQPS